MNQPFSKTYIKKYLLFYVAVVALVSVFFLLNHFYNTADTPANKSFKTVVSNPKKAPEGVDKKSSSDTHHFKLLERVY